VGACAAPVGMRWEMCRLRRGSLSSRSSRPMFSGLHSSSRRSVVKALFSRNRMKGPWRSRARYLSRGPRIESQAEAPLRKCSRSNSRASRFSGSSVGHQLASRNPPLVRLVKRHNWAVYSWVIAKAASRGSATWITHCSQTAAAAGRSRLALCLSPPDTGRCRGRQIRPAAEPGLFVKKQS
jgi:hypothetical protein